MNNSCWLLLGHNLVQLSYFHFCNRGWCLARKFNCLLQRFDSHPRQIRPSWSTKRSPTFTLRDFGFGVPGESGWLIVLPIFFLRTSAWLIWHLWMERTDINFSPNFTTCTILWWNSIDNVVCRIGLKDPLGTSVQVQEDYVGRPSRASRRVSIRRIHRNVVFRILILQCRALIQADHDERGMNSYSVA